MYICYEHSMYVSHIHVWVWYRVTPTLSIYLSEWMNECKFPCKFSYSCQHQNGLHPVKSLIRMTNVPWVQTSGIYHSHRISALHNDFKKQVLINNCSLLLLFNFIVLFSHVTNCLAYNFYKEARTLFKF